MKYLGSALLSVLSVRFVAADYADNANSAINTLQDKYYNADTGLWKGAKGDMWWQSGNMVEAIARFGQQDADFKPAAIDIISNTYAKSPNQFGYKNWINDYYDDEGWWALAWIAAHDLTGDIKYLNTAIDIFNDMTNGWGTSCNNGGVWWRKEKDSITSIANELFISVAAHIANRVGDNVKQDYVNWAENAWDWFLNSGVINGDNLINDGLDVATCKNNGGTEYTYNQGVILGGLSELARAKSDGGFIDHADALAGASTTKMTRDNGILTELVNDPIGTNLDEQGAMFKGAYIRGLATLNANDNNKYADFLKKNADSVWDNARNGDGVIKDKWQGGDDNVSASTQASGIDVLVAAAAAS